MDASDNGIVALTKTAKCDYVYNKNKRYTPLLRAKNSSVYSSLCFVNK
uniref:Uncharacterized protein n=1 Tax=Peronospora matthiolae TaxID=2874970 RepID=A0AAV1T7G3_9STRA